jgi:metalloendopeptidase OMA1, mitochondrial
MSPRHWLMKSEPHVFSIEDLEKKGRSGWDGVRNYQARNFMREMKPGDQVFFYHSSVQPPGIAGLAEVVREAYPDPSQFDPKSDYYEPKATPDRPMWFQVDVRFVKKLRRLLSLDELKGVPALSEMPLFKRSRLSVQPVTPAQWKSILSKAALILLAAFAGCRTVPMTGRKQLVLIGEGDERKMGLTAYQEALSKERLSTDAAKVDMVRRVGKRLAAAADKPDFQWEFNLVEDDKTINAWCLPGGKVAVYTGLLKVTEDEAGLAVVMGHEIAHALARHGGERMSQGLLAQAGGMALAVALSQKPDQTQQLAQQAYGLGVGVGVLLPYSRHQESEADRIGLTLMAKAGYDPEAALGFWDRMAKATGEKGSGLEKYLSTHPPARERIEDIRKRIPEARAHYKPAR